MVFTKSESEFYKVLKEQVGDRYVIFAKTRIIDFINVKKTKNSGKDKAKIIQKHVDFLLCSPDTFEPMVAIELNGKSHESEEEG